MNKAKTYLLLACAALLAFAGCAKDTTTEPSTDSRAAFLGSWNAVEHDVKYAFVAVITAEPNSTSGVLISNFAGIGTSYAPARAIVSGNTITLDPGQVIGNGLVVNGSGTISGGTAIHWNYSISDGANLRQVVSTYTKN